MSVVRTEDLTIRLDGEPVLRGISMDLSQGRMAALVGPNGSGKTTLLRALAGLLPAQEGGCRVAGMDPWAVDPRFRARTVAYLPQNLPADLPQEVLWVVASARRAHMGSLAIERREDLDAAQAALEELGISHLAGRPASALSGGELQLVMLASVLATEAQVLLLDEPTSMLDPGHQLQVVQVLARRCRTKGQTILAAIHDLNLASGWFDEIFFLVRGRLLASGAPPQVLTPKTVSSAYGDAVAVLQTPFGTVLVPRPRQEVAQ